MTDRNAFFVSRLEEMSKKLDDVVGRMGQYQLTSEQSEVEQKIVAAEQQAQQSKSAAEKELLDAVESQDNPRIVKAHIAVAEAAANFQRVKSEAGAIRRDLESRVRAASRSDQGPDSRQTAAEPPSAPSEVDTALLDEWKDKNVAWYGVDTTMTQAAMEVHRQIEANGLLPTGSPEYFKAIDVQMREKFPQKFGGDGALLAGGSGGERPTGEGQTAPEVRMTSEMEQAAAKWGIKPEDWLEWRAKAAGKGHLPSQPGSFH